MKKDIKYIIAAILVVVITVAINVLSWLGFMQLIDSRIIKAQIESMGVIDERINTVVDRRFYEQAMFEGASKSDTMLLIDTTGTFY